MFTDETYLKIGNQKVYFIIFKDSSINISE